MLKARISNYKTSKFDRNTKEKRFANITENVWKPKATIEINANESKFARLNQTPRISILKSKSRPSSANFHGKIEKTKMKRSKSLSTKQRNN